MEEKELLEEFKKRGALLEGHFILSSGLRSPQYLQSALLLQDPVMAQKLGTELAEKFRGTVDAVLSPALGGLIIGHEVARAKKCRALFSEKDQTGKPVLRRGFRISQGEKILIIEDVVTTGLSTREVVGLVKKYEGTVAGVGAIVNRSGQPMDQIFKGVGPSHSLLNIEIKTYKPEECPPEMAAIAPVKPGSRNK